jgi:hypothetical protein
LKKDTLTSGVISGFTGAVRSLKIEAVQYVSKMSYRAAFSGFKAGKKCKQMLSSPPMPG